MRTLWLRSLAGVFLGIAFMTVMMSAAPPPAYGAVNDWSRAGDGNWNTDAYWSLGTEPVASDDAEIDNGYTVTVSNNNEVCNYLMIGDAAGEKGTVSMTGGSLTTGRDLRVGNYGYGKFFQSGGTITCNEDLFVATFAAAAASSYTMSGGYLYLSSGASNMIIGSNDEKGTFTQSDNAVVNCGGNLRIGNTTNSLGIYNMSGGTLTTTEYLMVGNTNSSSGTFSQSGNTVVDVGTYLYLGNQSGAHGTYQISGGNLNVGSSIHVGYGNDGYGAVTQSGTSTVSADYRIYVGTLSGATGAYDLQGGLIDMGGLEEVVGEEGTGTFTQTGGTNQVATLYLGHYTTGRGTYNLNGGVLNVSSAIVNGSGIGELNIDGGTLTGDYTSIGIYTFRVGSDASASGSFTLEDGDTLDVINQEQVGRYGTGAFTQTGGTNSAWNLYVGLNDGSIGTYTQSGGVTTIENAMIVSYYAGSRGTYELSGGVLDVSAVSGDERIGRADRGVFVQTGGTNKAWNIYVGQQSTGIGKYTHSGGTVQMFNTLVLGYYGGAIGTYELSNEGVIDATASGVYETVGSSGTGFFTQTGGTNMAWNIYVSTQSNGQGTYTHSGGTTQILSSLVVGYYTGSSGTYELSGTGVLDVSSGDAYETIGSEGTGVFKQTGGTNTARRIYVGTQSGGRGTYTQSGGLTQTSGDLILAYYEGSYGTYSLSASGVLNAGDSELIGKYGTGVFTQTGGTNTVTNSLYVGTQGGGTGTYALSGGTLITTNIYLNNGMFEFTGGSPNISGNFVKSGGTLKVTSDAGDMIIGGDLTVTGGGSDIDLGDNSMLVSGNIDISGDDSFAIKHGYLRMDGPDSATVSVTGANNNFGSLATGGYLNIWKDSLGATVTLLTDVDGHHLTIRSGTLDTGGKELNFTGVFYCGHYTTEGGRLVMSGGTMNIARDDYVGGTYSPWYCGPYFTEDISGGLITVAGNEDATYGTAHFAEGSVFTPTGGTFQFVGSGGTASIYIAAADPDDFNFWNLTIGDGTNAKTVEMDASSQLLDVDGDFTISPNATFITNGKAMEVAGSWTHSGGTFTAGSNTVTFNGTGEKTITTGAGDLYDVTFDGSGSTWALDNNMTVAHNVSLLNGTVEPGSAVTHAITGDLTFGSGGTYELSGGTLSVGGAISGSGTLNMDGGALSMTANSLSIGTFNVGYASTTTGSFELVDGKTVTATTVGLGSYGTGTLTLAGGTLTVGSGGITNGDGTSTLNIDGGVIDGAYTSIDVDNLNIASEIGATGSFTLSDGQTLTADNIVLGPGTAEFNFIGGELHVGTFTGDLVQEGGVLAPGHSPGSTTIEGDYTLEEGATLRLELEGLEQGVSYDYLNVLGDIYLNGTLELLLTGGFMPAYLDLFSVMHASGSIHVNESTFDIDLDGATLSGGLYWVWKIVPTGSEEGQFEAVPEPFTMLSFIAGIFMLALRKVLKRRV